MFANGSTSSFHIMNFNFITQTMIFFKLNKGFRNSKPKELFLTRRLRFPSIFGVTFFNSQTLLELAEDAEMQKILQCDIPFSLNE